MPNKRYRNKRNGTRFRATDRSNSFRPVDSVKDLLSRVTPALTRVSDQASNQTHWRRWLDEHLPPALCQRVSGVVESNGTLVIFAESAAWSARLRFALQDLPVPPRTTHPEISQVVVRVLPKT